MPTTATNNYGEYVGVSDLYIASITADSASAYTPGTPKVLAPSANIAIKPKVNSKTRYYSNKPYYTSFVEGETELTLEISGIDVEAQAEILGKNYNSTSKRLEDTGSGEPPYMALGFALDVEGGRKYYWYLRGRFMPYEESAQTKTDAVNEKTTSLTFTALPTEFAGFTIGSEKESCLRVVGDSREDSTLTDTTWFASVQKPSVSP